MSADDDIRLYESNLRALRELEASRGWAIVREEINSSILRAAYGLADNPTMSTPEVDFRRGAISCARNMLDLVQRLIAVTENELLLTSAHAEVNNPNAAMAAKEQ